MNRLLKFLGFINCFICKKMLHKFNAKIGYFADSPEDFEAGGYSELVCDGCIEWMENHING